MMYRVQQVAVRQLCTQATGHSFITTPIFYVNAAPHIGHLYSAVLADASHRWQRLRGVETAVFATGTDEHGLKVQKAALDQGCSPTELCNRVSSRFKELFDSASIGYTDYIRTTESRHIQTVEQFWKWLHSKGHIYKGTYEGWYSVPDETFLSGSQVTDGPQPRTKVSKETGHPLEWSSEENYMFRLASFREQLLDWVSTEPYPVFPESARQQVLQWLTDETMGDLSVSRPESRLNWGIRTPSDPSQTIYVWLDALVNYLTVSHYPAPTHCWPATAHVVGKDILRFHAIYWPAFLLAAELPLPQRIVSHAHWTMGKTKMSKSRGNVVDPFQQVSKFGVDSVRYFLLKEGSLHRDGDYSEERLVDILNGDLANTLGNLLQRVTSTKLNPQGPGVHFSTELFPLSGANRARSRVGDEDFALINNLVELPDVVGESYESFEFNRGIASIMECLHQTNRFLERHKPWQLTQRGPDLDWLQTVLSVAVESLRISSLLLYPVTPSSAVKALHRLGFGLQEGSHDQGYGSHDLGHRSHDLGHTSPHSLQCLLKSEDGIKRLRETARLELGGPPLFKKV